MKVISPATDHFNRFVTFLLTCSCRVTLPASQFVCPWWSPFCSCCCGASWPCSRWSVLWSMSFTTFTFRRLRRVMAALPEHSREDMKVNTTVRMKTLRLLFTFSTVDVKAPLNIKLHSTFKHFGYFSLIWLKLEGRQKTKRTKVKCHNGRNAALQRRKSKSISIL